MFKLATAVIFTTRAKVSKMNVTHRDCKCHNDLCRATPEILASNTRIIRTKNQPDKDFLEVTCLNPRCNLYNDLPPGVSVELAISLGCPVTWVEDASADDLFGQLEAELTSESIDFGPLEHADEMHLRRFHDVLFDNGELEVPLVTADEWMEGVGGAEAQLLLEWLKGASSHRIMQELMRV
jgi:hypothetical protein